MKTDIKRGDRVLYEGLYATVIEKHINLVKIVMEVSGFTINVPYSQITPA